MKRILRICGIVAASIAALWILVALGLALSSAPDFSRSPLTLPASALRAPDTAPCRSERGIRCFPARDGTALAARTTGENRALTILFLHGVLSSSAESGQTARMLHEATGATVIRLDLRGHGVSGGRPGDLDYIGQYEDDVADVVKMLRKENPGTAILLAGHSMGGGIALRYAARRDVPEVEGYLLFAPHLGQKSPTTRTAPVEGTATEEPLMKVHIKRTIGLVMLNALSIRALNGRGTLYFNLGDGFPIHTYTFRAMASMAPDDYKRALTADRKPLLTLVGEHDEAFRASEYPAAIALHGNGRAVIIKGATHDGVMHSAKASTIIRDWITDTFHSATPAEDRHAQHGTRLK